MTFDLMVGSNSVALSKCQSDSGNNGEKKAFAFPVLNASLKKKKKAQQSGAYIT